MTALSHNPRKDRDAEHAHQVSTKAPDEGSTIPCRQQRVVFPGWSIGAVQGDFELVQDSSSAREQMKGALVGLA
jgi:hypothetical protein